MLSGLLAAFAPAAPAAAGEPCGGTFERHLGCWARWIDEGAVRVTVDRPLEIDRDGRAENRRRFEETLSSRSDGLLVEVPSGVRTGQGGSVLLVLADHERRLVASDAVIDPLKPGTVAELTAVGACESAGDLCARLAKGRLDGADLVRLGLAADLSRHTYTVSGTRGGTSGTRTPSGETTTDRQEQDQGKGQGKGTGNADTAGRDPAPPEPDEETGWDTATEVLTVLCTVLVLLLGTLLFLIRRSARSVAVGTLSRRPLAAPGVGTVPATTAPRPRSRPRPQMPDEATTRLRATPSPRSHGRRVGNVPGPARPAVVRTELHPQGYVEVDHVLYRAVWAEPGRPPPAPGGLVDVTDAERGSDVLYAFPPTPGRHAKAARP
ncbi:hypothetical protein [Streptomyces sp. NPDC058751]|uniref:hypothetical protein n=1 Tax=Streptomyces sp. NPDC058751 TaxID=3346623 RepID=UPI00369B25A3